MFRTNSSQIVAMQFSLFFVALPGRKISFFLWRSAVWLLLKVFVFDRLVFSWVSNDFIKLSYFLDLLMFIILVTHSRVDLHTPKLLMIQFHTAKIIIIQFHTTSVWRKCLSYNFHTFSKNTRKKIKPFLRLFENSWTKRWQKKLIRIFFGKNACHTISIYDKNFSVVILKTCPKFFCFFSTANLILYANKHFSKKKILHANNTPCKRNRKFLQAKFPISFAWRVFVCLDQCLIIWKFKNVK